MIDNSPLKKRVLQVNVFAGGRLLDLRDHHVYLNAAELSSSREPNKAAVTVYNLGEKNRGVLSAEHQGIEIVGGYDPHHGLVFRGQTYQVNHEPPGQNTPEWVTTIQASDSGKEFLESWASLSWPSGTPLVTVAGDLARSMGLPVNAPLRGTLASPWCCNARAADALSEFCDDRGLAWQIYQGVIELRDTAADRPSTALAVKVAADSGMVGAPTLVERKPKGGQKRFGVSAKMQMNAGVRPGGLVEVVSRKPTEGFVRTKKSRYKTPGVNGIYRVRRAVHYGSLHTPDFYTEFETEAFFADR